jgi:hypothetical protein
MCISRAGCEPNRAGGSRVTAFKHRLLPKRCVGFTPTSAIARRTRTRRPTRHLGLLLAGAATLLLRLLRDAEAWATQGHIFSPPCLGPRKAGWEFLPFLVCTLQKLSAVVDWDPTGHAIRSNGNAGQAGSSPKATARRVIFEIQTKRGHNAFTRDNKLVEPRYNAYSMGFLQAGYLGC